MPRSIDHPLSPDSQLPARDGGDLSAARDRPAYLRRQQNPAKIEAKAMLDAIDRAFGGNK